MSLFLEKHGPDRDLTWRERLQFELTDHGVIRHLWTNLYEIAPGVWRSNQPGPARLSRYKSMGIRSVISLRAAIGKPYHRMERKVCQDLGLNLLEGPTLGARELLCLDRIREIEKRLRSTPKPFVFHCKSGADRTGFVAALYLILVKDRPAEEALDQLRLKYVHLRRSRSGVLSHVFRAYLSEAEGRSFGEWLDTDYDPVRLTADFEDWRRGRGRWA